MEKLVKDKSRCAFACCTCAQTQPRGIQMLEPAAAAPEITEENVSRKRQFSEESIRSFRHRFSDFYESREIGIARAVECDDLERFFFYGEALYADARSHHERRVDHLVVVRR